jgi:ABC-2 type transport system ATP-binding protein
MMIQVSSLSKRIGAKRLLDDVSIEIDAGIVALIGRNGAGKTTLLRILSGIWKATSGAVSVGGHDLAASPTEAKRLIGYQPEYPDLHPKMRPRELFDFVAAARRVSGDERDAAIARFGISNLLDTPCGALSQGQRRLVTLVAGTMHNPPVLLLDEPSNALDPHRVAALRDYLRSPAGPRAALVSTHQLDFVLTLAVRFILLREGRLVADGTLPELRAKLRMPDAALEEIVLRHA